jgi:putative addiction module CopG family antidote
MTISVSACPENLPLLDFVPAPTPNDKVGLLAILVGLNPITQSETTMRTTQQLSITLSLDMADVVKAKVRTGEYATESEVIRDGLRALLARDRAVESWLHHQVGPAYDALKADPARAVTVDQVRARLAAEHAKAR